MIDHKHYMKAALAQANLAQGIAEVPVGCVIVRSNEIIATGYNRRETDKNCLSHAEIIAINKACEKLGGWRLENTTLYVTMEPCPMCAGAIINARIPTVVFGAYDYKAGCFGSVVDFTEIPFNHKPEIISGVLAEECSQILKDFFRELRNK